MPHPPERKRRQLLQSLLALGAWPGFAWGAKESQSVNSGRLVVVFLRGAYDGLSALVPYADPNYYRLRPSIAIAAPDGTDQTTIKLDDHFGLHPAMASLLPLWQQGLLAVLPCAGSPDPTRSHFDAQNFWESGTPGKTGSTGWMNAAAGLRPNHSALAVGEANPLILTGPVPVQLVPRGQAATHAGVLGNDRAYAALQHLYAGSDPLSEAFRAGASSRLKNVQTLTNAQATAEAAMQPQSMGPQPMMGADNGAGPAKGLLLDARHLATLMRHNRQLRLGFLSAGGWDTHVNQGAASGLLARNLGDLARTLVQLQRDFSETNDVVLVASEFGRTAAENGTRGTDHGHGNAIWLLGKAINGGRWHGQWTGLAQNNLNQGRDLPVHHDYRAVLAQVLSHSQGISSGQLDRLFPGFEWDRALDGLLRTT